MGEIDQFLAKFTLFGIPALGLIVILVQLTKMVIPINSKWYLLLNIVWGLIVAGAIALVNYVPAAQPFVWYILAGILLGAAAGGAYSGFKSMAGYKSVPPGSDVTLPDGKSFTVPDNK